MKKIMFILGIVIWWSSAHAIAAPDTLSFTGQLSTSAGPVDGSVAISFTVFDKKEGGNMLWTDSFPVEVEAGHVNVTLGRPNNPLDKTVFNGQAQFLEVKVGNEVLSPRLSISSVPYAISSSFADKSNMANIADIANKTSDESVQRKITCKWVKGQPTPPPRNWAYCPAGYIIMGGGCYTDNDTSVTDSQPLPDNSWLCHTTAGNPVIAMANCCIIPP